MENVREELTEQIKEGKLREVASELFEELQNAGDDSERLERSAASRSRCRASWRRSTASRFATRSWPRSACCGTARRCSTSRSRTCCCSKRWPRRMSRSRIRTSTPKSATRRSWRASSTQDGQPDIDKWIQMATEEQGVSKDQYLRDSVWPSAALKKLTGSAIEVTQGRLAEGLRSELRRARPLPGDRAGQHAAGPGSVGQGPAEHVDGLLRRPGRGVLDRADQQVAARRGAADPPPRRPAAARRRGVRAAAGRALGHHPAGRQVRDPQVRRPHRAGRSRIRRRSARSCTRTSSRRSSAWR